MAIHRIDLGWKVGDRIKPKARGGGVLTINRFDDNGNAVGLWKTGPRYNDVTTHVVQDPDRWELCCHRAGAPFERKVIDTVKVYEDGFAGGFYFGLRDQFYQAGGPGCTKLYTGHNDCHHMQEYDWISALENKIWRAAWRDGQEKARMKKPLDFSKPLRLGDREVAYPNRKVHYVGAMRRTPDGPLQHYVNLSISDTDPPEWTAGREFAIDEYGLPLSDGPSACWIENVPEKRVRYYMIRPDQGDSDLSSAGYSSPEALFQNNRECRQALKVTREGTFVVSVEIITEP